MQQFPCQNQICEQQRRLRHPPQYAYYRKIDSESPRVSFDGGGERPYVRTYAQKPKFYVGDKVYLINPNGTREGPYLVGSVISAGTCTLSLETGAAVRNGAVINMNSMELA
ncbi:hypothetical protein F4677DRAFT_76056 [Hypoxylon crocopeplum]|nr:hypothetical protein F4677DRAFT_76056 [Hypoxylon crocopeplum]